MAPAGRAQSKIRRLRTLAVATAAAGSVALAATPAPAGAGGCAGVTATPASAGTKQLAQATLCLLNEERARYGIKPLRLNARLSRAALGHSRDMVARHYFAHTTPAGVTFADRIKSTGYLGRARSWIIGENLDWGTQRSSSPAGAVNAWMHSPPHRANVLRRSFREIGIGIVVGGPRDLGSPVATYTTDFGAKGISTAR